MRIYLVQHGESRPEEEDPQRRLTDEGVRNVQKVARFLRPLGLKLETIWHSGKQRAQQTAEILAGAVSASQGMRQRNGLAPKDPIAPVKQAIEQSAGELMIVGHLPFLGKLTALLVADNEETEIVAFRFGCVACVERIEDGPWKLAWMIVPALLGARLRHLCDWADLRSPSEESRAQSPMSQQFFPFAKVAPEAHAFRDLECRDHTPFDLLAGLDCRFSDQRTSVVTAAQAGGCLSQTDRVWSAAAALEQSRSK